MDTYREKNIFYKDIMQKKIKAIDSKFNLEIIQPGRREKQLDFKTPLNKFNFAYNPVSSNMNMNVNTNQNYLNNISKDFNSSIDTASLFNKKK